MKVLFRFTLFPFYFFRPLSRTYSSHPYFLPAKSHSQNVSVPFRGPILLVEVRLMSVDMILWMFPSPIGDLFFSSGSINNDFRGFRFRPLSGTYPSHRRLFTMKTKYTFPSPFGDLFFSSQMHKIRSRKASVSVPFRGPILLIIEL